ncbi:HAD family hydrolase [Psychroflexus planctonicus]|uniref:phosphoglycolate phosphatase n=1 Tax=Psychroflexus planctonicus TaxID=1526575 RepID=A0ABQ1SDZ3_9FLAO|nr:HAD hydrolase-like protein [Psychroflexus planctonicus]GGE32469.1 hydrolase [Psychroflexus planctonicus]
MITTIFWDFDGVLMNSNAVRDKGFEMVLANYPKDQVKQLMNFHQANGGLSRYVKFRYFFEEVRCEKITDEQVQVWADQFSEIMLANLINKDLLIKETLDFVKENYQKYNMHIVSGSDGNELRQISKGVGIDQCFKSIEGSPTPKKQLVANVLNKNNYTPKECVLIGDSINDFEAAHKNKIQFLAYNNKELVLTYPEFKPSNF